jgi:hypothetical protein
VLGRLGAIIKGMLSRRLTYSDLHILVESSLMNPTPFDFLTDSAHMSWSIVTGGEDGTFHEHWCSCRLEPLLREISEHPTHGLQRHSLRAILLDEAAKGKWAAMVLKLSVEDVAGVLQEYPNPSASANSLDWKLNHVSLELLFTTLNSAVLLELGTKGFGLDPKQLEAWANLYAEAVGQQIAQAALLGADYGMPPSPSMPDAQSGDILYTTMSIIAAMREEIASDRADVEQNAERYEQLVKTTRSLLGGE